MAERLSTLEAGFLHAEDADRNTTLGIGGLAILDGPIPDHDELMATLGERIAACPRFAQRLNRRVLDLGAPQWVDDGRFRLAEHVRRVAVPAPGTDHDLFAVVADLMSWRLERDRPLWEIWVIDGLSDGRWAMLMKVHPCLADGVATVHILTGLSDNGITERPPAPHHEAESVVQGRRGGWLGLLDGASEVLSGLGRAEQTLRGAADIAAGLLRSASPLTGPITTRRRYVAARVDLDDVRRICRAFAVTVEDVALAALTESYRSMLLQRGDQLGPDSLRTLVPLGTQSVLLPRLPAEEENPVLRLRLVQARLAAAKAAAGHRPSGTLAAATRMLPFPVAAWAMNLLSRLPQRSVVTMAVQLPGPSEPLQLMGRRVVQVLPIPPIGLQLRTGVAILSYADRLFFGVLADFSVADADELARGIEAAVARLLARSKRRKPARDRHGLSLVVTA